MIRKQLLSFLILFAISPIVNSQSGDHDASVALRESYHSVKARPNARSDNWQTYTAITIDPELSPYGGWKVRQSETTGFYRVERKDDRWWVKEFIDGYGGSITCLTSP